MFKDFNGKKKKAKLGQMKRSMTKKKKNHKYILNAVSEIKLSSLYFFFFATYTFFYKLLISRTKILKKNVIILKTKYDA